MTVREMVRAGLLLAVCAWLSACTAVPTVDETVGRTDTTARPEVMGARGPLTARQSQALFARMGIASDDWLQRHLAIEQAVAETPLIAGNRTLLLRDGIATFRAMFAAVKGAKRHVNLEYYIFEDVVSDGQSLGDLLVAKRAEGVAVNIIYDGIGSIATPRAFFDRLKDAGVQLVQFNPVNPFAGGRHYPLNDRDHRKILVVDGGVGIIGGVNLSTSYQGSLPGKSSGPGDKPATPWRDTDLQISGPAVAYLQRLFFAHWTDQKGPAIDDDAGYFPAIPAQGTEVVHIIGSTPEHEVPRYYVTVLSAIRNAEAKIWLSAAYFVPTPQEMEDLLDAARRGVDVRLLLPGVSDSELTLAVQHSRYEDLLEAGIKIYERHDEILHSKTMVIDGVWSIIGSSNFDHRSVIYNDEVDAVVVGGDTAREFERMFEDDVAHADPIDPAAWRERPIGTRLWDFFARVWQRLL